jgi:catechol 2,3-dioxygenase-like lactoylglutathione lyase family enzyme
VTELAQVKILRLACIGLTTPNALALGRFYEHALGFSTVRPRGRKWANGLGASGISRRIALSIGNEVIELNQFDRPGRPYPRDSSASDLIFQHFAIVVADMAAAYRQLCSVDGWSTISIGGPQRLPPSSGGVVAFKFRDPDGHPLELLAFPEQKMPLHWKAYSKAGLFLGIDHSAINVSDSKRSIAFYETLGLQTGSCSVNTGIEQARLDGLTAPRVEVTAQTPPRATPHVELLCYRSDRLRRTLDQRENDVAATRLVFDTTRPGAANAAGKQDLVDPDGHHLILSEATNADDVSNTNANTLGGPSVFTKSESTK